MSIYLRLTTATTTTTIKVQSQQSVEPDFCPITDLCFGCQSLDRAKVTDSSFPLLHEILEWDKEIPDWPTFVATCH